MRRDKDIHVAVRIVDLGCTARAVYGNVFQHAFHSYNATVHTERRSRQQLRMSIVCRPWWPSECALFALFEQVPPSLLNFEPATQYFKSQPQNHIWMRQSRRCVIAYLGRILHMQCARTQFAPGFFLIIQICPTKKK